MPMELPVPTPEQVQRIAALEDPVIRNLQITQCYHELSAVLAQHAGNSSNWCTFATWASKQAGQTIRKEDLVRLLERRLEEARQPTRGADPPPGPILEVRHFARPLEQASAAVALGNKKVFAEIGYEFARFYHTCLTVEGIDADRLAQFSAGLHPGDPPEGQTYLRRAFKHYAEAISVDDEKAAAELMLLANIEVGLHEQTRLQPEIAASLDVGFVSSLQFARLVLTAMLPGASSFVLARQYMRSVLGRPSRVMQAVQDLQSAARAHLRHALTEAMMTITLPSHGPLQLARDLVGDYPDSLRQIINADLKQLLLEHDVTFDSLSGSGVFDWADLRDRLHFIIDLFRCYQEDEQLFAPPFTPAQEATLKEGRVPAGQL